MYIRQVIATFKKNIVNKIILNCENNILNMALIPHFKLIYLHF